MALGVWFAACGAPPRAVVCGCVCDVVVVVVVVAVCCGFIGFGFLTCELEEEEVLVTVAVLVLVEADEEDVVVVVAAGGADDTVVNSDGASRLVDTPPFTFEDDAIPVSERAVPRTVELAGTVIDEPDDEDEDAATDVAANDVTVVFAVARDDKERTV